jgi:isoleucyl-tRNA synthetase
MIAFRQECRAYAEHWLNVQREEFKRLGVEGDWSHPYTTMSFPAEAQIARELMKFAANGTLYRGSKPVMWSVVEKTALAEAEVEYEDYTSDTVWVKFPVAAPSPRVRGEGRGEGDSRHAADSPSPGAQQRADLSPQAGRGEKRPVSEAAPSQYDRGRPSTCSAR